MKSLRALSCRKLGIETFESRIAMDAGLAAELSMQSRWQSLETFSDFEGETAWISRGNELLSLNTAGPRIGPQAGILSRLNGWVVAQSLDNQMLTIATNLYSPQSDAPLLDTPSPDSPQSGLSWKYSGEVSVFDVSNSESPTLVSRVPIDGGIADAIFSDDLIVLTTYSQEQQREPFDAWTVPEIASDEVIFGPEEVDDMLASMLAAGASETIDNWHYDLAPPLGSLQVLERNKLAQGVVAKSDLQQPFNEIHIVGDEILVVSTHYSDMTWMSSNSTISSDPFAGTEPHEWHNACMAWIEPTSDDEIVGWPVVTTSTELQRWTIDRESNALVMAGSLTLDGASPLYGNGVSVLESGDGFNLITVGSDAERAYSLTRVDFQDDGSLTDTEFVLPILSAQDWVVDYELRGDVGVIATGSQLIVMDLSSQETPFIISQLKFEESVSSWQMIDEEHWLRISNSIDSETGSIVTDQVTLENIDLSNPQQPLRTTLTSIEADNVAWGVLSPDAFRYAPATGHLIVMTQPTFDFTPIAMPLDSEAISIDETPILTTYPILEIPQSTELRFIALDANHGKLEMEPISIAGSIQHLEISGTTMIAITGEQLITMSLAGSSLVPQAIDLDQLFTPLPTPNDPTELIPVDLEPEFARKLMTHLGLSMRDSWEEDGYTAFSLESMVVTSSNAEPIYTLTVNDERWRYRLDIDGEPVRVVPSEPFFHNETRPTDTDGDGFTTPLDVLIVINEINRRGSYALPDEIVQKRPTQHFDVNGDSWLSALDVLWMVNSINRELEDSFNS